MTKLVLLPGLVCDATVWAHARGVLGARADVQVAEYGRLDSLGTMADKVLGEVEGSFALAGHSMGGRIALEMFRRAPQRIQALALMDTGVQPLAAGEPGARETAGRLELLGVARTQGMAAMAARWVQGMVWPPRLVERALLDGIVAMFARSSADVFAAQIDALLARPDASALLEQIRCPTLVLCGAEDSWAPAARHKEMAARIAGAQLTLVPDCGHMCTLERPETVTQALDDWFAAVAPR
ncbi:MAG: alpha/beta fold hydrolase [Pseudomonadota bacterium]